MGVSHHERLFGCIFIGCTDAKKYPTKQIKITKKLKLNIAPNPQKVFSVQALSKRENINSSTLPNNLKPLLVFSTHTQAIYKTIQRAT